MPLRAILCYPAGMSSPAPTACRRPLQGEDPVEAGRRAADFESRFEAVLEALASDPAADIGYDTGYGTVNCAMLCRARDLCLSAAGFVGDIYEGVKAEENAKSIKILPGGGPHRCADTFPFNHTPAHISSTWQSSPSPFIPNPSVPYIYP